MGRRSLYEKETDEVNIFQAFTDLMSNAFMIMSLFLLILLFQAQNLNRKAEELNKRLQSATPIIIDERSGNFQFKSGSAELTPQLKKYITEEVSPQIKEIVKEREIAFIQVIGHTDGQKNDSSGNLDAVLEQVAQGKESVSKLKPGSNADLALMRALAVIQELKNTGLKNVKFRAYSAAQLYLPSGELAPLDRDADQTRRRIEIRFIPPGQTR